MTPRDNSPNDGPPKSRLGPFRHAVLRGLALLLPPLLTIVIFLWVGNSVQDYLLEPLQNGVRWTMVEQFSDIRPAKDAADKEFVDGRVEVDDVLYAQTDDGKLIPAEVYDLVDGRLGTDPMPPTAKEVYQRYVDEEWLQPELVIPIFLCLFVLVLYLLGKFLAAGIGRFFWNQIERVIHRVPLVRNVYSSVKQVTDFLFTEPDIQYTRVVACEYPRKGVWTMAFVTGESLLDIRSAANEPVLSVLIPTSPMPFTGFTVTVKKSETVDLDISVDQAFQFVVSCGVVVPPQQVAGARAAQKDHAPVDIEQPSRLEAPVGDG